jgi:hypothetical protein
MLLPKLLRKLFRAFTFRKSYLFPPLVLLILAAALYKLYSAFKLMDQRAAQAFAQYHFFNLNRYAEEVKLDNKSEAAAASYFASLYPGRAAGIASIDATPLQA